MTRRSPVSQSLSLHGKSIIHIGETRVRMRAFILFYAHIDVTKRPGYVYLVVQVVEGIRMLCKVSRSGLGFTNNETPREKGT